MRNHIPGTNVAVFALFFLLSLLEALGKRNWGLAALWLVFGLMFLRADLRRGDRHRRS